MFEILIRNNFIILLDSRPEFSDASHLFCDELIILRQSLFIIPKTKFNEISMH